MTCKHCGYEAGENETYCMGCGRPLGEPPVKHRRRILAGLLAVFLGIYGIHNFYLGYRSRALCQLLLTLVGGLVTAGVAPVLVWVWALFEAVQLFTGRINRDGKGIPLT